MKRFGVVGVWLLAAVITGNAQEPSRDAVVKKLAQEIGNASIQGDYAKVIDLTHEGLVKEMGGRDQAIKTVEMLMQAIKEQGIEIKAYKAGDPGEFLTEAGKTFVVVPTVVEMTIPNGKAIGKSYLLGISSDGKTWKFADGAGLENKEFREKVLPKLPDKLKLPAKEKPEIIKDK